MMQLDNTHPWVYCLKHMARILLVDDEDCILRTTAILLESEGHSTVSVLNGKEAINQLNASEFDIMITDIRMAPMDGMELIRYAHGEKPGVQIVVVSAYGSEKTTREALSLGAVRYLKKPFRVEDMMEAIAEGLKRKQAATASK